MSQADRAIHDRVRRYAGVRAHQPTESRRRPVIGLMRRPAPGTAPNSGCLSHPIQMLRSCPTSRRRATARPRAAGHGDPRPRSHASLPPRNRTTPAPANGRTQPRSGAGNREARGPTRIRQKLTQSPFLPALRDSCASSRRSRAGACGLALSQNFSAGLPTDAGNATPPVGGCRAGTRVGWECGWYGSAWVGPGGGRR